MTRTKTPRRAAAAGVARWRVAMVGFAAAVLPPALPLAVLATPRARWRFERGDVPWFVSVVLYLTLSVIHGALDWNALGVGLAWLVLRSGRSLAEDPIARRAGADGLGVGVAVLACWSLVQVLVVGAARGSGPAWFHHPNVFAHAWIPLGVLLVLLRGRRWSDVALLVAAGVALTTTGSRSGVLAAVVAIGVLLPWRRWRWRRALPVAAIALAVGVLVLSLAPRPPWLDRIVGPWLPAAGATPAVANLLLASEELDAVGFWAPLHVSVARVSEVGVVPAEWRVERTHPASWSRPQQSVTLAAGQRYTLTAEFRGEGDSARPGLLAWGQDDTGTQQVSVSLGPDGVQGAAIGRIAELEATAVATTDGWTRLTASFRVTGEGSLRVGVGPNPDLASEAPGARVDVRALQLEQGLEATAYAPGPVPLASAADRARGEALARLPLWSVAWSGFREHPVVGRGYGSFAGVASTEFADGALVPHPHNQALATAYEGGLLGIAAVASLLVGLWQRRSRALGAVLAALLVANLFDATLLAIVVLFPTALLAGFAGPAPTRSAA